MSRRQDAAAHPQAMGAVVALLDASKDGELTFRAGTEAALANVLASVPTEDRAGLAEVSALLGLVVVLRDERRSPRAAEQLDAALTRSPQVVQSLIALERVRVARTEEQARRLAAQPVRAAPRHDLAPPMGSLKRASLGGSPHELERQRALRRSRP